MIDYGTRHTDLALKRLEARLRAVYRQAEKDIAAKTADYWKRHAARDEKYRQQVKDGKLSKEDYEAWQRGQVFQGDAWTARKGEIQNVLYNADAAALQMINDGKVDAFAANANYMGYALEHGENVNFGFSLYDGPTVTRLLKDNPQILPKARVKKEKAYVWYNKLVNNCVLQGIIQGESIGEIAERIGKTTGERTRTAMLRNARTAYTGAQNAGRLEGMRQAEKLGVNVKKRWMATLDARTRDAHADLDGQVQDRDKPFKSPLGDIMFPGDPTAKPGLVYNCRCTITYVYPEYASTMPRRDNESGEVVGDMTYREWEAMKQGGGQALPIPAPFSRYTGDKYDEEYRAYAVEYSALEEKATRLYDEVWAAYRNRRNDPGRYRELYAEYENTRLEYQNARDGVGTKYGIEVAAYKARKQNIVYNAITKRGSQFDEDDVIARLGGGDMTKGSCASLGFCWAGQKAGYDVLDFRDGDSRTLFSTDCVDILKTLSNGGVTTITGEARSYMTAGKKALRAIKDGADGKEYYFECARHAAIVRNNGGKLEYLELQSADRNGWRSFTEYFPKEEQTLNWRFGAPKTSEGRTVYAYAVDVDEMASSERFLKLLGYINTDVSAQHKGAFGHER